MAKLRFLILGGNGQLGRFLTKSLYSQGHSVRVFDHEIQDKIENNGIRYFKGDFADYWELKSALKDVDYVVHLISTTVPGTSNLNPVSDIKENLISSVQLLELMLEMRIRRIIFASSGGTVYGNIDKKTIDEESELNPICSYGIVKVSIEKYIKMHEFLHELKPTILRISNLYGNSFGRIGVQGIISTIFTYVKQGKKIEIWGDGLNVRDYVHVRDVIRAINCCIERDIQGVFNIGSGRGVTIQELVDLVRRITGLPVQLEYLPARPFDVRRIVLDIRKANRELHWKPEISLESGCAEYWEFLKSL
ncbi:MAG: NAD-dependent epimerase/dehydratase family protein [Oligoflexales bacterium]|nr:NAD-dependent epimerase/dehydratase family protein [Oligoflexales bacterium]